MKYGILIENPYDGKPEGVVGPYDSEELAEAARDVLIKIADDGTIINGHQIHIDCIGILIPVGSLAELDDLPLGPSGFIRDVDEP